MVDGQRQLLMSACIYLKMLNTYSYLELRELLNVTDISHVNPNSKADWVFYLHTYVHVHVHAFLAPTSKKLEPETQQILHI